MTNRNTVKIYLTDEEVEKITQKMEALGVQSRSAFIRKMALDGYCIQLDLQAVREMNTLLRYCSNNLNQYAKRANEIGNIYEADIQDLQVRFKELIELNKAIMVSLSRLK